MFNKTQLLAQQLTGTAYGTASSNSNVNLGFQVPSFDTALSFGIRFFFVIAGLIALIYLILGALSWITSGGNKESVDKAREKIQAAIIGIVLIFIVLAVVGVLENVLNLGLGITRPIVFPKLINN